MADLVTPKIENFRSKSGHAKTIGFHTKNPKFRSTVTFSLFNIFLIGQNWMKATIFLFLNRLSDSCYNEIEFWCEYPYGSCVIEGPVLV